MGSFIAVCIVDPLSRLSNEIIENFDIIPEMWYKNFVGHLMGHVLVVLEYLIVMFNRVNFTWPSQVGRATCTGAA